MKAICLYGQSGPDQFVFEDAPQPQPGGGPDQLKLVDLPLPICGPDQVVIKIQAAGVGMWDMKVRQGRVRLEGQQFPLVLGWESAGTIEQVGARVTGLGVSTQVICATYQVGIGHERYKIHSRWTRLYAVPWLCSRASKGDNIMSTEPSFTMCSLGETVFRCK